MGLRIFGAVVAAVLAAFVVRRYRKGQLRRGEALVAATMIAALACAAAFPDLLNPVLSALGFQPGQERRIIGLLVVSNLLTLALLFRGMWRDDQLSAEIGDLVDYMALRRLYESGWTPTPNACAVVIPGIQ